MAALDAQDTDARYEVVIVDDGSRDATPGVLEDLRGRASAPLRAIRFPHSRGPAAARNAGWRAAAAPIVAFTDDDCVPDPGWLRGLLAGLDGADFVQGRTELDPSQDDNRGPFSHFVGGAGASGYYETCNIAYRRAALEAVDGFDEGFRHPFGEDTDLAWRVKAAGGRSAYAADAVVLHDIIPLTYGQHLARLRRREGLVRALARNPGRRADVGLGIFLRPTHAPALAAVAAGVVAGVRPSARTWAAAGAAAAGCASVCRWNTPKPARRAQWAVVVPMRLGADVYEIAVLARASARHRTVLL
jgi:GT2 family glycosyltransferase